MSCPDVDCKRFAVMTLSNLTANTETRRAATRGGGLQATVRLLADGDGECRRYAATCVCNMANDHQMQVHAMLGSRVRTDSKGDMGVGVGGWGWRNSLLQKFKCSLILSSRLGNFV